MLLTFYFFFIFHMHFSQDESKQLFKSNVWVRQVKPYRFVLIFISLIKVILDKLFTWSN